MKENRLVLCYKEIILTTLVYALFYTFCLYHNLSGMTMPFWMIGSYCYFIICLKRIEISVKWDLESRFQLVCSALFGISTAVTDNEWIQFFNFIGFLLLLGSFLIHQVYDDSEWGFGKHIYTLILSSLCTLAHVFDPIIDGCAFFEQKKIDRELAVSEGVGEQDTVHQGKYVLYGILLLIPILAVVMALLASADLVFGTMLGNLFTGISISKNVAGVIFLTIFAFFAAYSCFAAVTAASKNDVNKSKNDAESEFDNGLFQKLGEPVMAITVTSVLAFIYFIFCMIQIVFLFGRNSKLPDGFTYAEYARTGFFQLLFVCVINLAIVLVCLSCVKENSVLKVILAVISVCTFVMIASSAFRMLLYVSVYLLTFLRVLVLWSLVLLTLLLTGILITVFRKSFPLFRYWMLVVTVMYLVLSFSHQDYWIAKYNISVVMEERNDILEDSRLQYLDELSLDAVPVVADAFSNIPVEDVALDNITVLGDLLDVERIEKKYGHMTFRTFNVSRWVALQQIRRFKD